jgi:hypothetical protein
MSKDPVDVHFDCVLGIAVDTNRWRVSLDPTCVRKQNAALKADLDCRQRAKCIE